METTKKFDKRAFTSIGLLITAIILPVSIFLRHTPAFENSEQSHHLFTSVHSTAGVLFIIFFVFHLKFNWKAFKKYLSSDQKILPKKEAFVSIAFVVVVITLISTWHYLIH